MAERRAAALRRQLVGELERRGVIRSKAVRAAFLWVPRELFVPEAASRSGLEAVYRDEAIPTKFAANGAPISSSSQPAIMAEMLERLALEPGMRVLEIGAGTGYNAALLSQLVGERGRVETVDIDAETAARARRALRAGGYRARVVVADGRESLAAGAPSTGSSSPPALSASPTPGVSSSSRAALSRYRCGCARPPGRM